MNKEIFCRSTDFIHLMAGYYYLIQNKTVYYKQGLDYKCIQELDEYLEYKTTNKEFGHRQIKNIRGIK